jgi:hypothetical protein
MIEVVQAFDRAPIAKLESDDAVALERKIKTAHRLFANRQAWPKPPRRIEILRKLAVLIEGKREHLGRQIAREGGKPLTDALIETESCDRRRAQWRRRAARHGRPRNSDGAHAGEHRSTGLYDPRAERARDQTARQVVKAYEDLKVALRQRDAAVALLAAAERSDDAALDSYRRGVATFVDVTNAQTGLTRARTADTETRSSVFTAVAALAFGTGDLAPPQASASLGGVAIPSQH